MYSKMAYWLNGSGYFAQVVSMTDDFDCTEFKINKREDDIEIESKHMANTSLVMNFPSDKTKPFYYEVELMSANNSIVVGTLPKSCVRGLFMAAVPSSIFDWKRRGLIQGEHDMLDQIGSFQIDDPWKQLIMPHNFSFERTLEESILQDYYTYHGNSGKAWHDSIGNICGDPLTTKDVIGCGFDLQQNCVFFTNNEEKLDLTFDIETIGFPHIWYPLLGFNGDASRVLLNFGTKPFLYQPNKISPKSFPAPESFSENWSSHMDSALNSSEDGYLEELSDMTLVSKDGTEMNCHRLILSVRSKVLKAMIDPATNDGNIIHMKDYDSKTIRNMLRFMYCDKVNDDDIDMESLALANYYQLEALQIVCERKLCNELDATNALEAWAGADLFKRSKFKEICTTFICGKWSDVQKTDSYSEMMTENPRAMANLMAEMLNITLCLK